ncbi:MAG: DMT family transporter [Alphaproteobacteria bacterium]|nr:DMT family transporter [Alphaproteobacteria bacterium]
MIAAAWPWALGAAFLFALGLVLSQRGLAWLGPVAGASVSVPSAALLFWAVAPWRLDWAGWHGGAAAIFAGVGVLYPAVVTFLTFEANRRLGPNLAGALGNLTPAFAVGFAVLLLGELPDGVQAVALLIIVAGVSLMSWRRRGAPRTWPLWVLAVPLAGAAIRGLLQPATKTGLALWDSAFAATLVSYSVSALVILAVNGVRLRVRPGGYNGTGVAWFVATGIVNGLAVMAMYQALSLGRVTVVAPLVATYPLFTLALSWLLLAGVRLTPRLALAIALTVAGVALLLAA